MSRRLILRNEIIGVASDTTIILTSWKEVQKRWQHLVPPRPSSDRYRGFPRFRKSSINSHLEIPKMSAARPCEIVSFLMKGYNSNALRRSSSLLFSHTMKSMISSGMFIVTVAIRSLLHKIYTNSAREASKRTCGKTKNKPQIRGLLGNSCGNDLLFLWNCIIV